MKKILYIFITALLFSSCAAVRHQGCIVGSYIGQTPSMGSFVPRGEMSLSLNPDGSFDLHRLNVNYNGKWELTNNNDKITLQFNEITAPSIMLRSGIISDRQKELIVVNRNKVRFDNHILKRTNKDTVH